MKTLYRTAILTTLSLLAGLAQAEIVDAPAPQAQPAQHQPSIMVVPDPAKPGSNKVLAVYPPQVPGEPPVIIPIGENQAGSAAPSSPQTKPSTNTRKRSSNASSEAKSYIK